jgi:hypothetical protein
MSRTSRIESNALLLVLLAALGAALPATASAGTIEGSATEAGSGAPIAGLSVCAEENYVGGVSSRCTLTEPTGHYAITGLPAGSNYQVEFTAMGGSLNYLPQYYSGKEEVPGPWDPVAVSADGTVTGINAVMKPGAQIAGHVDRSGPLTPLPGIEVCVLDPAPTPRAEEFERCTTTDAAGNYTIRSLREGTFIVAFSRQRGPVNDDGFVTQWWDEAPTAAQATPIAIAPPQARTGIDADLIGPAVRPPKPPLHCKRHFRKRKVKGKARCVRRHRHKHRRRHGGSVARSGGLGAPHPKGGASASAEQSPIPAPEPAQRHRFNRKLAQRVQPDPDEDLVSVTENTFSGFGKGIVEMVRE